MEDRIYEIGELLEVAQGGTLFIGVVTRPGIALGGTASDAGLGASVTVIHGGYKGVWPVYERDKPISPDDPRVEAFKIKHAKWILKNGG